jgi:hypothetical protein
LRARPGKGERVKLTLFNVDEVVGLDEDLSTNTGVDTAGLDILVEVVVDLMEWESKSGMR